jgi:hypothetical protein
MEATGAGTGVGGASVRRRGVGPASALAVQAPMRTAAPMAFVLAVAVAAPRHGRDLGGGASRRGPSMLTFSRPGEGNPALTR